MNEKKSNRKSKSELPPLVPDEVVKNIKLEAAQTFGYADKGEYHISVEFGIEDSEKFNIAYDRIIDNDTRQRLRRFGRECYYVTFDLTQIREMLKLYDIVKDLEYYNLYVNHRRVPYIESLWIPLFKLVTNT